MNIKIIKFLGKGQNGSSFLAQINNKDVAVKITKSESEYKCSKKLQILQSIHNDYLEYCTKLYDVSTLNKYESLLNDEIVSANIYPDSKYIIIADYLICNNKIKKYFEKDVMGLLLKYCFETKQPLSEIYNVRDIGMDFETEEVVENIFDYFNMSINKNNQLYNDLFRVLKIILIHKQISAGDLHSGNLGYFNQNGKKNN